MRTIVFIIILAVIVTLGAVFGPRLKGGKFTSAGNDNSIDISTEFTPHEITTMVKKKSANYIAGECEMKKFKTFSEYNPSYQATHYDFYLSDVKSKIVVYREDYDELLIEKISTWDNENSLSYVIRDKDNYLEYIDYLRKNTQAIPDSLSTYSSLLNDSTFLFDDCMFRDIGFNTIDKGFVIRCEPITAFVLHQK